MLVCKYRILFFFKLLILHLDTDLRDHGGSGVLIYTIKCEFCVRNMMINHFNTNVSKYSSFRRFEIAVKEQLSILHVNVLDAINL